MKRRITAEQLQELTEEQKQKLREWWEPAKGDIFHSTHYSGLYDYHIAIDVHNYTILDGITDVELDKTTCLPLLDIGQMIELLDNNSISEKEFAISHVKHGAEYYYEVLAIDKNERYETFESAEELVDALWQAVKQIL